jgi:hypothetical protein
MRIPLRQVRRPALQPRRSRRGLLRGNHRCEKSNTVQLVQAGEVLVQQWCSPRGPRALAL